MKGATAQTLPGLIIEDVSPDSSAARAGLKQGDRLLSYDDKPLPSPAALTAMEQNSYGKNEVVLRIRRGEESLILKAPTGDLGIEVRPELPSAALKNYQDGKTALQARRLTETIANWGDAAQAAHQAGDNAAAAWLYGRVAETNEGQRKWREAKAARLLALQHVAESGQEAARSRTMVALALCHNNLDEYVEAARLYDQARQLDAAVGNETWVAGDINNLGLVLLAQGDLDAAQRNFLAALAIKRRVSPDSLTVASTLNNLGNVARRHGKLDAAQDYYAEALTIKQRLAPDSLTLANTFNSLGNLVGDRGDLVAAGDYYANALKIIQRLAPDSEQVAGVLNNLGTVAYDRADLDVAEDYYKRSLAIAQRLGLTSLNIAIALRNLGIIAANRGDLQAAKDYFERDLEIHQRLAPNSLLLAVSFHSLGDLAFERGDFGMALDYHTRSLNLREKLAPNSLDVSWSLGRLGNVAFARGEMSGAKDYYIRALSIREKLAPNSIDVADCLTDMAELAFKEHRLADSRSLFTRALSIVEAGRRSIPSTEARGIFFLHQTRLYSGLLRVDLSLSDFGAAFATSERARARSLLDKLAERRLNLSADAPADLLREQDELDQKRSAAYAALAELDSDKESGRIAELQKELARYVLRQRELEQQSRSTSPKFANLRYPEPLDLAGAQAALDDGTLLLSYHIDAQQTYLFAVTRTSLKVITLAISAAELSKQAATFRKTVAMAARGNAASAANVRGRQLYLRLIAPVQPLVNQAKRVLICPDGPLHTLPFAALVSRTVPAPRYFIDDKPLHTIASMTVYAQTRNHAAPARRDMRLLALGDALYTREQADIVARNGELKITGTETPAEDMESASLRQRDLKFLVPLPGTRQEVEDLARLFGKSATIKLDQEATETAVREQSKDYTILHLAVHGWLDNRIGLNSGLVLSRPELLGRKATAEDNGLLQAWEIIEKVRLNADLVVLSACDTGLGEELKGEGLIGLTRAFQYAGAKSVVASLWGANDASTAVLMRAFYKELHNGASKDVALQKAMAVVRSNPKWRQPFYWSPFTLVGSWN